MVVDQQSIMLRDLAGRLIDIIYTSKNIELKNLLNLSLEGLKSF